MGAYHVNAHVRDISIIKNKIKSNCIIIYSYKLTAVFISYLREFMEKKLNTTSKESH